MPVFLDTSDADFEASFAALLSAKREDSPDVDDAVAGIIESLPGKHPVHLLPYHHIAGEKYDRLGLQYDLGHLQPLTGEEVERAAARMRERGLDVHIGG